MTEARLTPREAEVLQYAAHGKTLEEVAATLGISRETVKTHVFNVRLRLDALNLGHAIAISVARGLISV